MVSNPKLLFIVNPNSGKKSKNIKLKLIKQLMPEDSYEIIFTEYPGHAKEICKNHKNYKSIVAVGGDGTVNEIAVGLMNTDTPMGIIPSGSGNGFSNSLQIPLDTKKAIDIIKNGKSIKVDLAKAQDIVFDNLTGIGFDALIAHKFAGNTKRGFYSYLKIIRKELKKYQGVDFSVEINGITKEYKNVFLISAANGNQWGNKAQIAPSADLTDGLLNITVINKIPKMRKLGTVLRLYNRKIEKAFWVDTYKSDKIIIHKPGEIYAHVDGEPVIFKNKIGIDIIPKCLNVIVRI